MSGADPTGSSLPPCSPVKGLDVLVLEQHHRPGGAVATEQLTLPGFLHDVGAGFLAFTDSPAFRALQLEQHGLQLTWGQLDTCHPARDGTSASLSRHLDRTLEHLPAVDHEAWRRLHSFHQRVHPHIIKMLGPLGTWRPLLPLVPFDGLRLASMFVRSPAGLARSLFSHPATRRILPAMGMHVDIAPHDALGSAIGYMLTMASATTGFAVPVGGAGAVTHALLADLKAHGATVRLGAKVVRIGVEQGRARHVELDGGEVVAARHAIFADTSPAALFLGLLPEHTVPGFVRWQTRRMPYGWGAFKVDWALSGPVPWTDPAARSAAVVHTGEDIDDLARFAREARAGELPGDPYLVLGQQSLADPSRAPHGKHTLSGYTRVAGSLDPRRFPGGWEAEKERFADRIEARIEDLAPGFGQQVLARHITTPPDLERMSPNLVGGDLGGGSNQWWRQGPFRPVFPYFRYRTPVRGLYLCSSYTHPGTGVHGMCGYNAATLARADF